MSLFEDDPFYQPKADTYGDNRYCICYQNDLDYIVLSEETIKHFLELINDFKIKRAVDAAIGDDGMRSKEVLTILQQEREEYLCQIIEQKQGKETKEN